MHHEQSRIFKTAFSSQGGSYDEVRERLATSLRTFRRNAGQLAAEVAVTLPDLTDHSLTHLDYLWQVADQIAGPNVVLSPLEAYLLGGAILLHDLANSTAAFGGGSAIDGPQWKDLVVSHYLDQEGRRPTPGEISSPTDLVKKAALMDRLRDAHAARAETLATNPLPQPSGAMVGAPVFLIEDVEIRALLGRVVGRIAHSHHWDIGKVVSEFRVPSGRPQWVPAGWTNRPLLVACLLRAADAAQIDRSRTPAITRHLRLLSSVSEIHWTFQAKLAAASVYNGLLAYNSTSSFQHHERDAWWLAYDAIRVVDKELRNVARIIEEEFELKIAARGVYGASSAGELAKTVMTQGWDPVDVRFHVSDVSGMVHKIGGARLYAGQKAAAVRELIANSVDAVNARRAMEGRDRSWGEIKIGVFSDGGRWFLEVSDTGIGMSEDVLTGPLLDFGQSFWGSWLSRQKHPGLLSSSFRPVGRFGIGFFSVFMAGEHVLVHSRPAGSSVDDERVVELSGNRSVRPFIRKRGAEEQPLHDGGTRIRVRLRTPPFDDGGVFEARSGESKQAALERIIGRLAPAVDVSLLARFEDGSWSRVVEAGDWARISMRQLVERLGGERAWTDAQKYRVSGNITGEGGETLGRIALSSPAEGAGCVVVGGFTASSAANFHGVLLGENPSVARNRADPIPQTAGLKLLLSKNLPAGGPIGGSWEAHRHIAQLYLNCEIIPWDVPCFRVEGNPFSARDMLKLGKDDADGAGVEILVVLGGGFEVPTGFGDNMELDFEQHMERIRFEEECLVVFVGPEAQRNSWRSRRGHGQLLQSLPPGRHSLHTDHGQCIPTDLAELALFAFSQSRGAQFEEVESSVYEDTSFTLGNIDSDNGEVEVIAHVQALELP